MVLLYAIMERWMYGRRSFAYLQIAGDALVVTGFIGITGGMDSPMSFLYLLPITVAAMLHYRTGGLITAVGCWILYAAMGTAGSRWAPLGQLMDIVPEAEPRATVYYLVVHLVAFAAVAVLASYLSERLRAQGDELAERRGAVARLQALNENIIESINSGLVTTDLSGQVNFMNRGGAVITGLDSRIVTGWTVEKLFDLEPGFLLDLRKQLLANRRFRFEEWFCTTSGTKIFLGIAASNLYDRVGNPLGFIFIFQDLTEIQALEHEVRLRERMSALGEMAAGMAHELRNPLAAISGSVQYLRSNTAQDTETTELMDIIMRESLRLDKLIRDFLTFARPGRFTPERADLVRLIQDSIKLLTKSSEFGKEHRIQTAFQETRIEAEVDVNRLKQVFWNLATNALKAMPDGGTLTIHLEAPEGEDRIRVRFNDEGRGMSAQEMEQYFQPFQSSFREGNGLGAAIVYRLIEEHHGRIGVESSPGGGTSVVIDLPGTSRPAMDVTVMEPTYAAGGTSL
jgi:two-component system sensor histidine kinase PilS (NtrC family)